MVYIFHGENAYASWQEVLKLTSGRYDVLDGAALESLEGLSSLTGTLPMFKTEQKAVVVKRFFRNKRRTLLDQMLEFLGGMPRDAVDLIFWEEGKADARTKLFTFFKKNGKVDDKSFLKPFELIAWLRKQADNRGLTLGREIADRIIMKAGTDQFLLENELGKLKLLLDSEKRKEILADDLELVSAQENGGNIWELMDAISARDRRQMLSEVNQLLTDQRDYSYLVTMITRQLKLLYLIKNPQIPEQLISKSFGYHPYVISKAKREQHRFTTKLIITLYNKLAGLDLAIKEGKMEARLGLNLLLSSF
jgi:DNA polymerase-3 subunit delta